MLGGRGIRLGLLSALALVLAVTSGGSTAYGQAKGEAAKGQVPSLIRKIEARVGRISVDVENADVVEVLDTIQRQTGIKMSIDRAVSRRVTSKFENLSLERGIRVLLKKAELNYAMLYTEGAGGEEEARLSEVKISMKGGLTTVAEDREIRTRLMEFRQRMEVLAKEGASEGEEENIEAKRQVVRELLQFLQENREKLEAQDALVNEVVEQGRELREGVLSERPPEAPKEPQEPEEPAAEPEVLPTPGAVLE